MSSITCLKCPTTFTKRKNLYAHIRNTHDKEPIISSNRSKNCVICPCCSTILNSYGDFFI